MKRLLGFFSSRPPGAHEQCRGVRPGDPEAGGSRPDFLTHCRLKALWTSMARGPFSWPLKDLWPCALKSRLSDVEGASLGL